MNVTCDKCGKKYGLADDKVRGKTVRVRCKACQTLMTVVGPPYEEEEHTVAMTEVESERLRAQAVQPEMPWADVAATSPSGISKVPTQPAAEAVWYSMIRRAQVGPMSISELRDRIRKGEVTQESFLWRQGMADWKKGLDVPELSNLFAASTPIQPSPHLSKPPPPVPEDVQAADTSPDAISGVQMLSSRKATQEEMAALRDSDPFGAVYRTDPALKAPPGEATKFFILQSGATKKTPAWKIASFAFAFLAIPVGLLYLLSALNIVPLNVTRIDDEGNEISEPVFSAEGISGLADLLTGKKKPRRSSPASGGQGPRPTAVVPAGTVAAPMPAATADAGTRSALSDLYENDLKKDVGPKVKVAIGAPTTSSTSSGLSEEAVVKVVGASQAAFMQCVEMELKKNPNFKGGKVSLIAAVGPSGMVTSAKVDRRDIDLSDLGGCLKKQAKRMIFPAFSGDEETEVQIPLILTSTM